MEYFFVLCFTPHSTGAVFNVGNGFFRVHTDFIGGIPFFCAADCFQGTHRDFVLHKCRASFRKKESYRDCRSGRQCLDFFVSLLYCHFILGQTDFMVGMSQYK